MTYNLSLEEFIEINNELKAFFKSKEKNTFKKSYEVIERHFLSVFGYASIEYQLLYETKNDFDYLTGLNGELSKPELIKLGETIDKIFISNIDKTIGKELISVKRKVEQNIKKILKIVENLTIFDLMRIKDGEIKKISNNIYFFGNKRQNNRIVGKIEILDKEIIYQRYTYIPKLYRINIITFSSSHNKTLMLDEIPEKLIKNYTNPEIWL